MKKVLIITYNFLWRGGSGTLRMIKFAKYLPRFGWEPIFLTINPHVETKYFGSNEVPKKIKVYTTFFIDPVISFRKFRNISNLRDSANKYTSLSTKSTRARLKQTGYRGFFINILNYIRNFYMLHDEKIGWLPFAVRGGLKIMKECNIDAIYATGPPFVSHLIGYLLKKIARKPLILEYRDPWFKNPFKDKELKIIKYIEKNAESKFIYAADKVITVTESILEDFNTRYSLLDEGKTSVITNGFDLNDFKFKEEESSEFKRSDKFVITYTGSFYGRRSPENFLEAVKYLLRIEPDLRKDLLIRFIGNMGRKSRTLRNELKRKDILFEKGYVSHKESIQYLLSSDVLLLIRFSGVGSELQIPGKLFEYLGARKPILALSPQKGIVADLISLTRTGWIIDPDDIEQIVTTVFNLYKKWKRSELLIVPDWEVIRKYESKELMQRLGLILDRVISYSQEGKLKSPFSFNLNSKAK